MLLSSPVKSIAGLSGAALYLGKGTCRPTARTLESLRRLTESKMYGWKDKTLTDLTKILAVLQIPGQKQNNNFSTGITCIRAGQLLGWGTAQNAA